MRIVVVSSHKGFNGWVALMEILKKELNAEIDFLYNFSDLDYREDRSFIKNIYLRIKNFIFFPLLCIWKARQIKKNYDLVITVTNPFYLPILNGYLFSKTPNLIVNFDIYPKSLVIHGIINQDSFLEKLILRLMRKAISKASGSIYLLESHKKYALSKGWVNNNSPVIPICSGSPGDYFEPQKHEGVINFLYCGTLGLMHDYTTMLNFLSREDIHTNNVFKFYTSGNKKTQFEKEVTLECKGLIEAQKLVLGNSLDAEQWKELMISSQVGLVFQSVGAGNVIFPSKVVSVLSMGQAVLAVCDSDSDLGMIVQEHDCGWVVGHGDVEGIRKAISEAHDPEILYRKRTNAYRLAKTKFSITTIVDQWKEAIDKSLHPGNL
jgi:glycosyltransferase involved in cell wall biosynthesis